ncbi:MAG: Ig-like domain-containing protein [Planctomycetes bacterium]|nr:Ig-like domain-containing protein [Planctomycetota bacterium]
MRTFAFCLLADILGASIAEARQAGTLTVTDVAPAPDDTLTSVPSTITITLSAAVDVATANASALRLTRAGADGVLGTADDVTVVPSAVSVVVGNQIEISLAGVQLVNDVYRITMSGTDLSIPDCVG